MYYARAIHLGMFCSLLRETPLTPDQESFLLLDGTHFNDQGLSRYMQNIRKGAIIMSLK